MLWLAIACNLPPERPNEQVGYRLGLEDTGANSGERGTIKIVEVMWSGSVTNDGEWDGSDVFIELRNESARPVNLSGWRLQLEGTRERTFAIPVVNFDIEVDQHLLIAAKNTGCFPDPEILIPDLAFVINDPFELTLMDADERLIEPVGSDESPPFAGGYDGQVSRSMERINLMFGGEGTFPHSWHYYTTAPVEIANNDRVAEGCRERTLASPGRANSPDYSGAFATGNFE